MLGMRSLSSLLLSSVFLLSAPGIAHALDLRGILEAVADGLEESNERRAIAECSQPSRRSDFWCRLFWSTRGEFPNEAASSNAASGVAINALVQNYLSVAQQRQAAEARYSACTRTSSSPMSCSSMVAESLAARESTYRDLVGQALMTATERTYDNPRLCPQTINAYRQAINAQLPFAANMASVVTFCRSRGMSF